MRVVIADDHGIVRSGIRLLLEKQGDIEVVAEAADGIEARDRRNRSGSTDLELYTAHYGSFFLSGEFSCNCPAWRARHKTQLILQATRVHFKDYAVDI